MDEARWELIQNLFHAALERPEAERAAFLRAECRGDARLAGEVEALLAEDSRGASVIDGGLAPVAGRVLDGTEGAQDAFQEIGPYRIERVLGEGGTGVVYLARREDLGSLAAVKVLRDAWVSPARRERFAAERRTLAQLNHPSIARLYDAGALADRTPWFVMEYVEGVPLTDYCAQHRTSVEGRLDLFRTVCEAVQHAHGHAVIHRDLKPSNILVKADGTVKLLDFGIAKSLESLDATIDQTRTGLRMMTPAYAAPEQIRGQRIGIQTDIYALGVILYELLAGRVPFDLSARTPAEAASLIIEQEPERPSAVVRRRAREGGEVPRARSTGRISWADLDVLCLTAMHKDPRRRYRTAEALIRDVDHYLAGEPLEARPDAVGYRLGKFLRRHRGAAAAATLALGAVVGLVALYTIRLSIARNEAVGEAARAHRIQRFMMSLFEGGDETAGPAEDLRVVSLLDRGVQGARSLDAEPAVQAELYATLGGIYQKLGNLQQAEALLGEALDRRRSIRGPDHPDVAASLVSLGLLRSDQADYDAAERMIRQGLEQSRRLLPADHPSVAAAVAALGHVLVERGSYAEALGVLEEAVRLYERGGPATPELAAALRELANAHFYLGNWAEAESLTQRVLPMSRMHHGERHPYVADDLVNLGAIQHEQGNYAGAERYYRLALDMTRDWYGPKHYRTASVLTMLGRSLEFQSRYDEAERLLKESLAIQESVFGPGHPRVASAVNELGSLALQRERFDEAEAAYRRTAAIYRAAHPGGHYLIGTALSNLASVYQRRKQDVEAERLFREAIAIYERTLTPDHLNVGIARIKLGRSLLRQRRYAEAEQQTRTGYDILTRQTDPAVSWLKAARTDLAAAYDALGQPEKAASFRAEVAEAAGRPSRPPG